MQFLLCSVDIKDKKIWSELITATGGKNENAHNSDGWELINQDHYNYKENSEFDFNYRIALSHARNFQILLSKTIEHSEPFSKELDAVYVNHRDASLIVDYHGNFLFIICYRATLKSGVDVNKSVNNFCANRSVIDNIDDNDWYRQMVQSVKCEVAKYVNKVLGRDGLGRDGLGREELDPAKIDIKTDAAFPLFFSEAIKSENLNDQFRNEENKRQRSEISLLSEDYEGSYLHVGWNYTLALRFPQEVNENIFVIMTKMQMSYYNIRFYKRYFNQAFNDIFENTKYIDSDKVDFFDRLKFNYNDFLANYYKFKRGLFPKYNEEMEKVEALWSINKDMDLMEKMFMTQAEFVNKKYSEINQAISERQRRTLNLIALAQVMSFLTVIHDSIEFESKTPDLFFLSLASVSLLLVAIVLMHYKIGANVKR
jgi:hypothetical protein